MNKPFLRLGFVDFWKPLDDFFISILSEKFDVVRDDQNPDYLIFSDETFGVENRKFDNRKDVVKIFYTGENRRFWKYNCEKAITFDHFDGPFHYRLPLYVIENWIMVNKLGMMDVNDIRRNPTDVHNKTGFCVFVSANGSSLERNRAFQTISQYKKVDSYGPLFNNVGYVLPRGPEAAKNKNTVLQYYKFNLCFENSSWPGYCTEKLFHALYMKTIPIYWGSPTSNLDFNPKAYINRHDFDTDDEFYNRIKEIDSNPDKYLEMYMQPIFSENRFMNLEKFSKWFENFVYRGKLK